MTGRVDIGAFFLENGKKGFKKVTGSKKAQIFEHLPKTKFFGPFYIFSFFVIFSKFSISVISSFMTFFVAQTF